MKKQEKEKPGFPLGKWEVEGIYEYVRKKSKWKCISRYEPGYMIWEFTEKERLSSRLRGKPDYETKYVYREWAKELSIDISYLTVLKNNNIQYTDRYRVDAKSPDEVWLYNLEDVICEPKDYWMAYKLERRR